MTKQTKAQLEARCDELVSICDKETAKADRAKDLLFRLARIVREGHSNPLTYGRMCMDMLSVIQKAYPNEYAVCVKGKKSVYKHQRDRQAKEYTDEGEYVNDKKPWTPQQLDILLDGFLDEYPMLAKKGKESLVRLCGRPFEAIKKALWRLGVCDIHRSAFCNYSPSKTRQQRTGQLFGDRDRFFLMLILSDTGIKNTTRPLWWLEKILRRDRNEIVDAVDTLYGMAQGHSLRQIQRFDWSSDSDRKRLLKFLKSTTITIKEFTTK